jgi:hypothetical protein
VFRRILFTATPAAACARTDFTSDERSLVLCMLRFNTDSPDAG